MLLKRSFFSLERCSADTGPFFFVPHSEQPILANKAEGRIGFCGSIRSQLMAFGWGLRPRTPVNGLCSRCGLGRFAYRRRAAVKSCPVIRWQGERMKRQGLRRALTGGRSMDRGPDASPPSIAPAKRRCHAGRQRLRTVARSVVGIASECLACALRARNIPPPPDSGEGGGGEC